MYSNTGIKPLITYNEIHLYQDFVINLEHYEVIIVLKFCDFFHEIHSNLYYQFGKKAKRVVLFSAEVTNFMSNISDVVSQISRNFLI